MQHEVEFAVLGSQGETATLLVAAKGHFLGRQFSIEFHGALNGERISKLVVIRLGQLVGVGIISTVEIGAYSAVLLVGL
ncbi:hypothetical protein [Glutamicibacter soli]